MRTVLPLLLSLSLDLPATQALTLVKRDNPAVVGFDFERRQVSASDPSRIRRRDKTVSATLDNEETIYVANVTLGTPAQDFRVILDTGSSDLWVNAKSASVCSSQHNPCRMYGSYDANASSTYSYVSSDFNITYLDRSGATGDYANDTLTIGKTSIEDFRFGIGYKSSTAEGVLGVGYTWNEAQYNPRTGGYANLPQALADQGLINSNAYSIWLDDVDARTGSILFGGVNAAKYHGSLETLPIIPFNGVYGAFVIALTGLSLNTSSTTHRFTSDSLPLGVVLDSGTSMSYLPDSLVEQLFTALDVTYDTSAGVGYLPCNQADDSTQLTFAFSSPQINVPLSQLVLDVGTATFDDGTPACAFGIAPAGANATAILGDTFLRSAYVVFDLANNEVSLAQTNFDAGDDDIREITSGHSPVPGATAVANPVTTLAAGGESATVTGVDQIGNASPKTSGKSLVRISRGLLYSVVVGLVFLAF